MTRKKAPAKKAVKKAIPKQIKTGGVRFQPGNQAAVKWTDKTIIPELNKILYVLGQDDSGLESNNIVRANDIKFAEEAVMAAGVDLMSWYYWNEERFQKNLPADSLVYGLIKKIKDICRLRLAYSGETMDIFLLKNHFNYTDKVETKTDVTTNGESINPPRVLSKTELRKYLKGLDEHY